MFRIKQKRKFAGRCQLGSNCENLKIIRDSLGRIRVNCICPLAHTKMEFEQARFNYETKLIQEIKEETKRVEIEEAKRVDEEKLKLEIEYVELVEIFRGFKNHTMFLTKLCGDYVGGGDIFQSFIYYNPDPIDWRYLEIWKDKFTPETLKSGKHETSIDLIELTKRGWEDEAFDWYFKTYKGHMSNSSINDVAIHCWGKGHHYRMEFIFKTLGLSVADLLNRGILSFSVHGVIPPAYTYT